MESWLMKLEITYSLEPEVLAGITNGTFVTRGKRSA